MPSLHVLRQVAVGCLIAAAASAASNPPIPPLSIDVPLAKQSGKERAVFAGGVLLGRAVCVSTRKGRSFDSGRILGRFRENS
jgi:hypothetical protein